MSYNTVYINIGNGIIIPVKTDFECSTEAELHAVVRSHYNEDASHFLEEYSSGFEFAWNDTANDETLEALSEAYYARLETAHITAEEYSQVGSVDDADHHLEKLVWGDE